MGSEMCIRDRSGKPEEIAAELASIEEKAGKETAEKMLATYQAANEAQKRALEVVGTSRNGERQKDFDEKVSEYQKENPDKTRAEAVKAIMRAYPHLYREAKAESRRIETAV